MCSSLLAAIQSFDSSCSSSKQEKEGRRKIGKPARTPSSAARRPEKEASHKQRGRRGGRCLSCLTASYDDSVVTAQKGGKGGGGQMDRQESAAGQRSVSRLSKEKPAVIRCGRRKGTLDRGGARQKAG